jgi:hypothetical protein
MYARNRIPLYEGDSFIHTSPAPGHWEPAPVDVADAVPDLECIEQRARGLRSETLQDLLGRAIAWIGQKMRLARRSALEEYLSRSSNLADLERRLREAERDGRFPPG